MELEGTDESSASEWCTKHLDAFFEKELYNSYQATDELIKKIEESKNEVFAKRALASYQRLYSNLEKPWDHVTFMYGLGLIYMHFNAYNWAIKAFRKTIYVQPNFARARDVHTRLGLMFKALGRYSLSEKHFNLALNDTRPDSGTSTRLELEFNLAHLYETQGKYNQAKEAYQRLLHDSDLPKNLSANIQRQIGWIYCNSDQVGSMPNNESSQTKDDKLNAALNYLNTSHQTDNRPTTSYYLGRCYTKIGRFQDAFASYRSVIDKEESTADTWCSIGVLYHRQNQPTDAQQAYIRSVQYDKNHPIAWLNLGTLYETHNQFADALKCYQYVLSSNYPTHKKLKDVVSTRIKYIQKQMSDIVSTSGNNGKATSSSDKLLCLEDLWNLESASSQSANNADNHNHNKQACNNDHKNETKSSPNEKNEQYPSNAQPTTTSNILPTEVKNPLVNGVKSEHDACRIEVDAMRVVKTEPGINAQKLEEHPVREENNRTKEEPEILNNVEASKQKDNPVDSNDEKNAPNSSINHNLLATYRSADEEEIPQSYNGTASKEFCLTQLSTNVASKDSGISSSSSTSADCALVPSHNSITSSLNDLSARQLIESYRSTILQDDYSLASKKIDINVANDECEPPKLFRKCPPYPPLSQDQLFPSPPNMFLESKRDMITKKLQEFCHTSPISIIRNLASVLKLDLGLLSTKALLESNPDHTIDVISHLQYKTSSESILDESNQHKNNDGAAENIWAWDYQRSTSTIRQYAIYQVKSFRESLNEEILNKPSTSKQSSHNQNQKEPSETDSNESANTARKNNEQQLNQDLVSNHSINSNSASQSCFSSSNNNQNANCNPKAGPDVKRFKKDNNTTTRYVKSADNIDISDEQMWRAQLNELNKLPHYIRCVSAYNMLTHIGTTIKSINTILMSMHVPGSRLLGNIAPNNFCSININIGPGDYEWCAIPAEYLSTLARLCRRNGFELSEDNWWPMISDLQKYNIPIYRFSQRPGDMVFVNSGTFYWAQATGWCNSVRWHIGPLNASQYQASSHSYELNKFIFRRCEVPMVQMTWNMAMNISKIPDQELNDIMIDVMRRSLQYCILVLDIIEKSKIKMQSTTNDIAPRPPIYCALCECEVFNYRLQKKPPANQVHCIECARRADVSLQSYEVEPQYNLNQLIKLYDEFVDMRKRFKFTKV